MAENNHNFDKPVAGVPKDVFSILSQDDKMFLTALDKTGFSLETLYKEVEEKLSHGNQGNRS